MKTAFAILALTLLTLVAQAAPDREHGIQVNFLPGDKVEKHGLKGFFTVTSPKPEKELAGLDTEGLLKHIRSLPEEVRENGVWIIYTLPAVYSDAERTQIQLLSAKCKEDKIALFSCTASKLNAGAWVEGCAAFK